MKNFLISTESAFDLPNEYIKENNIIVYSLNYSLDDKEYVYNDKNLDEKHFYNYLSQGKKVTTSASKPYDIKREMLRQVKDGHDVIHISFSSALSSSYSNALKCANEVMSEVKDSKIYVIDSKCVAGGLSILIDRAVVMRRNGESAELLIEWLENHKSKIITEFIVNDLDHLARGGRLSAIGAGIGKKLNVKAILAIDKYGSINVSRKFRGERRAMKSIVKEFKFSMQKLRDDNDNKLDEYMHIYISHADASEKADFLANEIKNEFQFANVYINHLTPSIGAHTGNDTIVLSYLSI